MLAEFALTPSIFDESAHEDLAAWREQLLVLGLKMFPEEGAWPVMISNLCDGNWHEHALRVADAIKDSKARQRCQSILQNAAKTLVHRPYSHSDWPGDDSVAWGREAISSNRMEPIERIVSCKSAHEVLSRECRTIRGIDEVDDRGFWKGISSQWSPAMKITEQVDSLRKVCVHSGFFCLVAPYIQGHDNDETAFALELIKSALRRPEKFPRPVIEIHTTVGLENSDQLENVVHLISRRLRSVLVADHHIRLVIWPKFLDRYLIAGTFTMSNGTRVRRPRWGVAMQHFAKKADDHEAMLPPTWSLLKNDKLGDTFNRYCEDGITGYLHESTISG